MLHRLGQKELQQKDRPQSFKLQDLVFLDSESIFVMPSAFNDDVQYGLQVGVAMLRVVVAGY